MERFKARYATDAMKENKQERKISKIVIKPLNPERKERSYTTNDQTCKMSSSVVRSRAHTSNNESDLGKDVFTRPSIPTGHKHASGIIRNSKEKVKEDNMSLEMEQDITKTITSDDARRLRRVKEYNISDKSPYRWDDRNETQPKAKSTDPRHAIHHISDKVFQMNLEPEDPSLEVIHRRAKSDLDQSNIVRSSVKSEAKLHRARHHSHDDQLGAELIVPDPIRKVFCFISVT